MGPGDLSTVVFDWNDPYGSRYEVFNFTDAQCPPPTLGPYDTISVIGQVGYNPFILPPSALTAVDPIWDAGCTVVAFQARDPLTALKLVASLLPSPTSADPISAATLASPISGVPVLPISTGLLKVSASVSKPQNSQRSTEIYFCSAGPKYSID